MPRAGWRDVCLRAVRRLGPDHLVLVAAGGAFFSVLALFPGIAATVAIWGLMAEPQEAARQIGSFTEVLPDDAADILKDQARAAAEGGGGKVFTATFAVLVAIWSSSQGANALVDGLNIAYREEEKRGILQRIRLRLTLTIAGILAVLVAFGLVVGLPIMIRAAGWPSGLETAIGAAKWAVLLIGAVLALAVLYRFGPSRRDARWSWISPGALLGVVIWMTGSVAFSFYVSNFATYNETYGTLGGVVILLLWLLLTNFAALLGGVFNAELERQTAVDTTVDPARPRGEREAHAADTLGEAPA